ncbi:hypothetical protein ACFV4K_28585 [Nocardia sp. NPDC059764]|uniref:hypothetical protein n=1 Tax=Nocardia sp. NPDC059764 TaxID=3346939 RepID=UPI00364D91DA
MTSKKAALYAAAGATLTAAVQAATGMATAATESVILNVGGGPDVLACQATAQQCGVRAWVFDLSTPVTISVNGKVLVTSAPSTDATTPGRGTVETTWTPQTAGLYTITGQQGSASQSISLQIIDNNSPAAVFKHLSVFLGHMACSGSGAHDCPVIGVE